MSDTGNEETCKVENLYNKLTDLMEAEQPGLGTAAYVLALLFSNTCTQLINCPLGGDKLNVLRRYLVDGMQKEGGSVTDNGKSIVIDLFKE